MKRSFITGIGLVEAREHWHRSATDLAVRALSAARADAGHAHVTALFVASTFAAADDGQANLGALLGARAGLAGVEVFAIDAEAASGGAALRLAEMAIASGHHACVAVVGVDKPTDLSPRRVETLRARSLDADREAAHGLTANAAAAIVMQRYLHVYGLAEDALAPFACAAHDNAAAAPHAFLKRRVSREDYATSRAVAAPMRQLDVAPLCDGAAALVVAAEPRGGAPVMIAGSAAAQGTIALADRRDPLRFETAAASTAAALAKAGRAARELSLFEVDDATTVQAALCLEAAGFADAGCAPRAAAEGAFAKDGSLPICTMGGNKARGFPLGAAGVYRVCEAVLQLRGTAGQCQVARARIALVQSMSSLGAHTITHVLEA
jgi:acetyl-CoA C-acetyltransferase